MWCKTLVPNVFSLVGEVVQILLFYAVLPEPDPPFFSSGLGEPQVRVIKEVMRKANRTLKGYLKSRHPATLFVESKKLSSWECFPGGTSQTCSKPASTSPIYDLGIPLGPTHWSFYRKQMSKEEGILTL